MRTCNQNFPGADSDTAAQLARDVAQDERTIVAELAALRQKERFSLESIGFLLGSDPGQISRALKGTSQTTLMNYIRIARALGYRSRLVFERADPEGVSSPDLVNLRIASHKVSKAGRTVEAGSLARGTAKKATSV